MAIQFLPMPRPGDGVSSLLDFSPLAASLQNYTRGNDMATQRQNMRQVGQTYADQGAAAAGKQALSMGELDTGVQLNQQASADKDRQVKVLGAVAKAAKFEQDPQRRAMLWQAGLKRAGVNPQDLDPEELDPMTGPDVFLAASGMAEDPLDRKLKEAQIAKTYTDIELAKQKPLQENKRLNDLARMGIDPDSTEGIAYIANGKLPAAAIERRLQQEKVQSTAPKIAAGLENLAKMADTYDTASFENSVGPVQGAQPDGFFSGLPILATRAFGEIANKVQGGKSNPSEVRSNIQGSTEALAAAIKPLIRGPGEGVWTDADQARLVSIVGDLAQARSKGEFRRRLNDVRDRVQANFDLDIPFDSGQPTKASGGRERYVNPQTGEMIEWNGSAWVPVQ